MSDSTDPLIEIRDPALDSQAIAQRVQLHVAQRQAKGAYGTNPAALGPEELWPERYNTLASTGTAGFPSLHGTLVELLAEGHLHEPTFSSNAPLVGPIIVMVRRFWNWMSAKWYVRPILKHQSDVNARTAAIISDLVQWQELDAERLRQLEARVDELGARLATEVARDES